MIVYVCVYIYERRRESTLDLWNLYVKRFAGLNRDRKGKRSTGRSFGSLTMLVRKQDRTNVLCLKGGPNNGQRPERITRRNWRAVCFVAAGLHTVTAGRWPENTL